MKFSRRLATVCIAFLGILSLALPQLTAASAPFLQNLQLRDTGDDITRLQQFLNAQEYLVAQSGPGSRGNETTTFGLHTYQALTQFQSAHGLPTTGFFGPLTRALVATLVASSTATSTTAVPQSPAAPAFSTLSSTTSGYIPGVTPLPGYKPGQLIFIGGGSATPAPTPPASAPPAPYVAKAVHFDGSTYLYINPLVVSDSPVLSASMWIKTSLLKTNGLFDFDPNNNAAPDLSIDNNHNAFNFYENQNGGIFFGDTKADSFTPDGRWHHILFFVDTNHAGADKIVQMYLDDQPLNFSGGSRSLAAFSMLMANLDFAVPDTPADFGTPLFTGDIADVYIAPGQFIDFSVEANRRKFISADGKPVDLGSNCSTPPAQHPRFASRATHQASAPTKARAVRSRSPARLLTPSRAQAIEASIPSTMSRLITSVEKLPITAGGEEAPELIVTPPTPPMPASPAPIRLLGLSRRRPRRRGVADRMRPSAVA